MTLSEMIRSEEYRNWESETIQEFGFSNPALFDRIQEAASEGIDGRTHAEIIEMWRDYLRNNLSRTLSDEEYAALEKEIDETWDWHLKNGSLEQSAG